LVISKRDLFAWKKKQ